MLPVVITTQGLNITNALVRHLPCRYPDTAISDVIAAEIARRRTVAMGITQLTI